jgi:hypothetical protein
MFQVFQSFQRYIAIVSYACCKSRSGDDANVAYVVSVSKACCKRFFKMFHLFRNICCNHFLSGCCICFHTYVAIVCSKYFSYFSLMLQLVSVFSYCNCVIWMLHMSHTHVPSVCPKCFICFKYMLHSSVSCCNCRPLTFVFMRAGRDKP